MVPCEKCRVRGALRRVQDGTLRTVQALQSGALRKVQDGALRPGPANRAGWCPAIGVQGGALR